MRLPRKRPSTSDQRALPDSLEGRTAPKPRVDQERGGGTPSRPLYPRLLRLRHIQPTTWQRAALGEGALIIAVLLVLADLASAWTLLVLPLAVAVIVKAHDLIEGALTRQRRDSGGP